jgi:hypothetical protein
MRPAGWFSHAPAGPLLPGGRRFIDTIGLRQLRRKREARQRRQRPRACFFHDQRPVILDRTLTNAKVCRNNFARRPSELRLGAES